MIYTVTFNPALDYVVFLDQLKLGDINRATRESIFYGGKGINVSTILNTLGMETTALGFVAGFTGKAIEEGLAAQGMHTDFIHLPEGNSRINVKVKHGDETEINGQGPRLSSQNLQDLFWEKMTSWYWQEVFQILCRKIFMREFLRRFPERKSGLWWMPQRIFC